MYQETVYNLSFENRRERLLAGEAVCVRRTGWLPSLTPSGTTTTLRLLEANASKSGYARVVETYVSTPQFGGDYVRELEIEIPFTDEAIRLVKALNDAKSASKNALYAKMHEAGYAFSLMQGGWVRQEALDAELLEDV